MSGVKISGDIRFGKARATLKALCLDLSPVMVFSHEYLATAGLHQKFSLKP